MIKRETTMKQGVTDGELAQVMPLVGALVKNASRAAHQVPGEIHAMWVKYGLAPRHMNLLLSLAFAGPASVSELSSRLSVGLPTASLVVGELSRVGLVVRTEDQADRRRTLVDLAPGYRQTIRAALSEKTAVVRSALAQLQPEERAALVKGLRALAESFETSAKEPAVPR